MKKTYIPITLRISALTKCDVITASQADDGIIDDTLGVHETDWLD